MRPELALTLAVVTAAFAGSALWRRHTIALGQRDELVLLPTESFDPSLDEVRRWAATVHATRRRRDWGRRRAEALRFSLDGDDSGRVTYRISGSRRALALLEPALPHQVEAHRPQPQAEGTRATGPGPEPERRERLSARGAPAPPGRSLRAERLYRARAELRVAPGKTHALAELGLAPDPIAPLVAVLSSLEDHEVAHVALDLQPLSGGQRRRALATAHRRDRARPDWLRRAAELSWLNDDPLSRTTSAARSTASAPTGALARLEARAGTLVDHDRFASGDPVFHAQLLMWADASTRRRARSLVAALVSGLAPMAQRARWRRLGRLVGPFRWGGPDSVGRRRRFDHRAHTGCHHPVRRSFVGVAELAGFITPPSVHCHAPGVVRCGGLVPPPPPGLPDWAPAHHDLWPLGEVADRGKARLVGVPLDETFFTASFGRSRYGKTEKALVALLHLAATPQDLALPPAHRSPGLLFCDPHGDGIARLMPYLVDHADRVLEVNLSRHAGSNQAGWNPLDMTGCGPEAVEGRVSMMAAAFAATLGWTERNNRGLNLVTQATASLCQLGLHLPPGLQPTIFQIITLLDVEPWRNEVMRFFRPSQRRFWASRLSKQTGGAEAITPVTNLLDRLLASSQVAALFGQSRSTFDMRRAMDDGRIVLLCPGGGSEDKEQLIHCLFLFELFRATLSRSDTDPLQRRVMHAVLDELQVADRGQSSTLVARMLQEGAKFGLRVHALVQQPTSLSRATLNAISTNRSHLFTTTVNAESAAWLRGELADGVEARTLTQIERYHAVASVTLGGRASPPFRLRGLSLEEVYGPPPGPDAVAAIERSIDLNMNRQPVASVLAGLDTLDARILACLRGLPAPRAAPPATPPVDAPSARRARPAVTAPAPDNVAYIDRRRAAWRPEPDA